MKMVYVGGEGPNDQAQVVECEDSEGGGQDSEGDSLTPGVQSRFYLRRFMLSCANLAQQPSVQVSPSDNEPSCGPGSWIQHLVGA